MRTTLQNLRTRLLASAIAIAAFTGVQAQCATSTTVTYQGSGNISFINQSTYTGGWDSYISVNFGDGSSTSGTGTSFSNTHQYSANGTYLVTSGLFAYDPADSSFNCNHTDYDTVTVTDIACSINVSNIGSQQGGGIYDWYFYSTVNSTSTVYSSDWVVTDSLGNILQSWSGTNGNSVSYTFPTGGYYNIGFSVMAYDSVTATYCSDSTFTSISIGDSLPSGNCSLQANVFAYSTGALSASIFGQANNSFTWSYLTVDGQFFPATDSIDYTFPSAGDYYICYYVEDSTQAGYCYDSTCILYTIPGPVQCNAYFDLWEDSLNVGQWYAINYSSGSGALTYMWDFGDGTTSTQAYPVHNYAVPGNYVICLTITDANACASSTCDSSAAFRMSQQMATNSIIGSLTVSAPVGIQENLTVLAETKVFPNPMTETSSVSFNSSLSANGKIEIVTILGATIVSENIVITKGNNEFKLNTSNLSNGVYYVNIIAENRVLTTVKAIK